MKEKLELDIIVQGNEKNQFYELILPMEERKLKKELSNVFKKGENSCKKYIITDGTFEIGFVNKILNVTKLNEQLLELNKLASLEEIEAIRDLNLNLGISSIEQILEIVKSKRYKCYTHKEYLDLIDEGVKIEAIGEQNLLKKMLENYMFYDIIFKEHTYSEILELFSNKEILDYLAYYEHCSLKLQGIGNTFVIIDNTKPLVEMI